jgi:opacity protein-like surface antigen
MKKIALVSALTLAAISAQAQTYGEIGYTSTTLKGTDEDSGNELKVSPSSIRGILGYELNPNLAVEGMAAIGVGDATIKVNGVSQNATAKVNNTLGVYLKPKMKLNDAVEIFGRVGYSRLKITAPGDGGSDETTSESRFSYGAGLSYAIDPKMSLNVDYMQYQKKDGVTASGFTLGVGYKF